MVLQGGLGAAAVVASAVVASVVVASVVVAATVVAATVVVSSCAWSWTQIRRLFEADVFLHVIPSKQVPRWF